MEFVGGVHIYIIHILYYLGLFIFKNDCFIVVALKIMVNAADNGYQANPIRNVRTGRRICIQHRVAVCKPTLLWMAASGVGGGAGSKLLIALSL